MAAPEFTIKYEDGTEQVVKLKPSMQMAYEAETGDPLFSEDEAIRVTKVYTLAWYAAGKPETLDAFADTLDSVEMVSEDTDEDDDRPTSPESLPD